MSGVYKINSGQLGGVNRFIYTVGNWEGVLFLYHSGQLGGGRVKNIFWPF